MAKRGRWSDGGGMRRAAIVQFFVETTDYFRLALSDLRLVKLGNIAYTKSGKFAHSCSTDCVDWAR